MQLIGEGKRDFLRRPQSTRDSQFTPGPFTSLQA